MALQQTRNHPRNTDRPGSLARFVGRGDETPAQLGWLLAILLFALLLRLPGLATAVPHPDARLAVERGFQYLTGDFNPGWFGWPGQTIMWMLAGLYGLYYLLGLALGWFGSFADFQALFQSDPQSFYVLGRFLMVAFALGTVDLVYQLARRFTAAPYALAAAFFLAISWLHQMHSQFVRPDIVSMFFLLLVVQFAFRIREEGHLRLYVYAGLALGAAVATKWVMAPVLFAPVLAHLLRARESGVLADPAARRPRLPWLVAAVGLLLALGGAVALHPGVVRWIVGDLLSPDGSVNPGTLALAAKLRILSIAGGIGLIILAALCKPLPILSSILSTLLGKRLLVFGVSAAALFLLVAPYALLDAPTLVHDLLFEARTEQLGAESYSLLGNIAWYVTEPLAWGYGWPLQVLALVGLVALGWRRNPGLLLILLLFPLLYFGVITNAGLRWSRWVIHLLPFLAILSGMGLGNLVDILRQRLGLGENLHAGTAGRIVRRLVPAVCLLVAVLPLWRIGLYGQLMRTEDTRVQAVNWMMAHLPGNAHIAMDALAGDLPPGHFTVYRDLARPSLSAQPLDWYLNEGWEYFVVSSDMMDRFTLEPERYADRIAFYQRLAEEAEPVAEFTPEPGHWPPPGERLHRYHIHHSPTIRIYRMAPEPNQPEEAPVPS